MTKAASETIEKRYIETVYVLFHPTAGVVTTEPYQESAEKRAEALRKQHGGAVYIIETPCIMRSNDKGVKRIYKLERDRLHIDQEWLT